jgi:hypothetical protein
MDHQRTSSRDLVDHLRAQCQRDTYAEGLAAFAVAQNDDVLLRQLDWSPPPGKLHQLYRSAVTAGADTCLAYFHDHGTPVDALDGGHYGKEWDSKCFSSAIRVAANRGHISTVEQLIRAGARPSPRNAPAIIDAIYGTHHPQAMVALLQSSGWSAWNQLPSATDCFPSYDTVSGVTLESGFVPCSISIRRGDANLLRTILSGKPTTLDIPDGVIKRSVQALITTGKPYRASMLKMVVDLLPTPSLAPGVDTQGRVLVERFVCQPDDRSMQDVLLQRSLLGPDADTRAGAACATLTEHARTELRLRGLAGLSWSPSGSGSVFLEALADTDRAQALAVLTARFLHHASQGDQASAKSLAQMTATCGKRGWSTAAS